jgi:hypothetical protein
LIAVALIDHTVMPAQCAPRRVQRTDVQTLLCRVTVKALPAFSRRFPTELPSRVIVTLHDGRVVANELSDYQGLHTRPQTWDDALAKFTALTTNRVADSRSTEIATVVHELETLTVADLTPGFCVVRELRRFESRACAAQFDVRMRTTRVLAPSTNDSLPPRARERNHTSRDADARETGDRFPK